MAGGPGLRPVPAPESLSSWGAQPTILLQPLAPSRPTARLPEAHGPTLKASCGTWSARDPHHRWFYTTPTPSCLGKQHWGDTL